MTNIPGNRVPSTRLAIAALVVLSTSAPAQWLNLPTPGIPRTPEGKPILTAPAPRTPEGKPDLSGLWHKNTDKYINNIAADLKAGDVAPWADALYQQRKLDFGKNSMWTLCEPAGPASMIDPIPESRIVQTPSLIAIVNNDLSHREIFLDGRSLEHNPNPTWMGYSVGHWDGDTLVVESNGYNDKTWLDYDGHPHTEDLQITERYSRINVGHMDLEITFTDPKVFRKPVTVKVPMALKVDTEMLEFVCENEKDKSHMDSVQKQPEIKVAPAVLARYVGIYDVEEDGRTYPVEITATNDTLYYKWAQDGKQPLWAYDQNSFSLAGTLVKFILEGDGPSIGLIITSVEGEDKGVRRR